MHILNIFAILLLFFAVVGNVSAKIEVFNLEQNYTIITMALFEKLNWIIGELKDGHQQLTDLNNKHEALKSEMKTLAHLKDTHYEEIKNGFLNSYEWQKYFWDKHSVSIENSKSVAATFTQFNNNWQTILRRQDGSLNFSRNWNDYKTGFGQKDGEFFLGLEALHALTTYGNPQELLVVLEDFDHQTRYAKYSNFVINSESEKYSIKSVGSYQGDAGDSLSSHGGAKFTTYDQDNDVYAEQNCAQMYKGGWWFVKCLSSVLSGPYLNQTSATKTPNEGIFWLSFHGNPHSLKYVEML